jgi:hypothetical protein
MAANKSYKYKLLKQSPGTIPDLEDEMNRLGQLGYRHVGEIESVPHVVMELEGIRTDEGTAGAFQAAGLKVKGKR